MLLVLTKRSMFLPLLESREVPGLIALGVLEVPGLDVLSVEAIDDDLEVAVWSNKHVVGAVEFDGVAVGHHELVQQSALVSGVVIDDEPGILFQTPPMVVCKVPT